MKGGNILFIKTYFMYSYKIFTYIITGICLAFQLPVAGQSRSADAPHHKLRNPAVAWEDLPYIRTGVQIWSHTSKSPFDKTVQDFLNYTTMDGKGFEGANYKGSSGMFVHCWFAFLSPDTTGSLKLYTSTAARPAYDMPLKNYFNTGTYPHTLWETKDAIWWAFPCMPFERQFRAVTSIPPQWYQYTLHTYREDRYAETLRKDEMEKVWKKMQSPGIFPGDSPGNRNKTATVSVDTKMANTAFLADGPGVIRQLRLVPPSVDSKVLDSVFIRITTDGKTTADLPLSFFFGGYAKVNMKNARGLPAGFDGKTLYNYFPMPYWKSFRIELDNRSAARADFSLNINWSDTNPYPANATGTFYVRYNPRTPVKAGAPDFVNLAVNGSGIMVGAVSQLTGAIEANFSIYVDGMRTPAIESTGGEDYFNHSYGIHPGFTRPFSGGLGDTAAYRFHIIDYIPFLNSLRFTQDHAIYWTHDRDGIFNSAVFYYLNPEIYLHLTDSIDVGKSPSEVAHHYQVKGQRGRLQRDTAGYGSDFDAAFSDEGRWTNGSSSFSVQIDPGNDGVRLRRRINQEAYHQEVKVYVDDKFAGTWFEQGANYYLNKRMYYNDSLPNWEKQDIIARFRDTEFNIPASLTKGKSSLRIRLESKGSLSFHKESAGLTNEYYYWVYCYRPL